MRPLQIHDEALAELNEAMGLELHDEVVAALGRIEADPGIGARYRNTSFRFYRVKRFPYLIYYQEQERLFWVAAIAHGRRRPNYWRKRKPS